MCVEGKSQRSLTRTKHYACSPCSQAAELQRLSPPSPAVAALSHGGSEAPLPRLWFWSPWRLFRPPPATSQPPTHRAMVRKRCKTGDFPFSISVEALTHALLMNCVANERWLTVAFLIRGRLSTLCDCFGKKFSFWIIWLLEMKQRPEPVLVAECSDRLPNIHPSRWRLAGGWAGHSSTCCRSGYSDLVKRRTDPVTQQRTEQILPSTCS